MEEIKMIISEMTISIVGILITIVIAVVLTVVSNQKSEERSVAVTKYIVDGLNKTTVKLSETQCEDTDKILQISEDYYKHTLGTIEKDGKETRDAIEKAHASIKSELK